MAEPFTSPLVGRDAELRELERALAAAQAGESAAVAVLGEAGIGKTRLLHELSERARASGFEVLAGSGLELERDVPFGLLADALDRPLATADPRLLRNLGDERLAELGEVLPSLAPTTGVLGSALAIERFRAHRAVREALGQLASTRPILLVLDDVHWGDPASLELAAHLLHHGVPASMLAFAYRPAQLPAGWAHTVDSLAARRAVLALEIGPLTVDEAAELLGPNADPELVDALHGESGGNPFYLEQLATTSGEMPAPSSGLAAHLRGRAPSAEHRPAPSDHVPRAVTASIGEQVGSLTDDARRLLEAAAVVGDPFDLDLAREVGGLDRPTALAVLDELQAAGLVTATEALRELRFRHPIVRRAVYAAAPPGWLLGAHRQASDVLARRAAPLAARAHHIARSARLGDEVAVDQLSEAAQATIARAPAEAAAWLGVALRLLPDAAAPERRLGLQLRLAEALGALGRLHECRDVLTAARELAPESLRGALVAAIARTEQGLGRGARARVLVGEALAEVEPDGAEAAMLLIELAKNRLMAGEWEEAVETAAEAHELAERIGERSLDIAVGAGRAWVMQHAMQQLPSFEEAGALIDRVATEIDALDDEGLTPSLLEALRNLGHAEIQAERFESAASHLNRGLGICRRTGQGGLLIDFLYGIAAAECWAGGLEAARRAASDAAETAVLLRNDQTTAVAQGLLCWTAACQGDLDAALAAGAIGVEAADRAPESMFTWLAHAYYGEALLEAGQVDRGRGELLTAFGADLEGMPPAYHVIWFKPLALAEIGADRIEAAEEHVGRIERATAGIPSGMRVGNARHARGALMLARGEGQRAAELALAAAESYSSTMPIEAARSRLLAGRALAACERPEAAARALEDAFEAATGHGAAGIAGRARRQLRRLGRRPPPRRIERPTDSQRPFSLTARQLEVAELVADGRTNRQIADRLYIGERTVESHLSAAFAKLEVSSRAAVAAAIERWRAERDHLTAG